MRGIKIVLGVLITIFFISDCTAQHSQRPKSSANPGHFFAIDTVRGVSPYDKHYRFIFPQIKRKGSQATATYMINRVLSRSILQIESGQEKQSIFERVWGSRDASVPSVSDISFKVLNNDSDVFCISITAKYCRNACGEETSYFTFESSTGKQIDLVSIFEEQGLETLMDSARLQSIQRVAAYSDKLGSNVAKLTDEVKQDTQEAITEFGKCGKNMFPYLGFSINKRKIVLYSRSCLRDDLMYLDKMNHEYSFEWDNVKDYLSEYGKAVLKR